METVTIASVLALITDVITAVFGWMGDVVGFVMANPLILISFVAFFFVGGAIALVVRLIKS